MDFGISGYNKGKVEELRDTINSTAQESGTVVVEELESGIITKMGDAWYAEEAVQYFEGFKSAVAACGQTIHTVFDQFRENIQKTGEEWATATGGEAPTLAALEDVVLDLNIGAIQKTNGAGDRALDDEKVADVMSGLEDVEDNIKSRLSDLASDLDASTAFLGGGQGEAIQDCFTRVAEAIHQIFGYLLIGDDALEGALTKFREKYSESATNVADSFYDAQVEITKGE